MPIRLSANSLIMLLAFAVLGYACQGALLKIADIAYNNDDFSHGLLLPFITAYLIWDRKDSIAAAAKTSSDKKEPLKFILGIILFALGTLSFLAWTLADLNFLGWLGFFLAFIGVIFLCVKNPVFSIIIGPVLLLFMAHPLPASVLPRLFNPLQATAAKASEITLALLGVPVFVQGNIIEIPGMRLMVEEACSGLRSVFAMTTAALIIPMLFKMSWAARIFLLILALVLAVVLNIGRVVLTGVLAYFYDPAAAEGFFHEFTGMIVFIIGLVIIYSFANWVMKSEKLEGSK